MPHLLAGYLLAVGMAKARDPGGDDLALPLDLLIQRLERAHATASRSDGEAGAGAPASRTSASATSSMDSSASTLTRSVGSWLRSVPLARFVHGKPAASNALASDPPPVTMW